MRVTSVIPPRITVQKVAGKNGHRTTMLARSGLLDMRAQAALPTALRAETPSAIRLSALPA
jgi:hypothetical protein